MSAAQAKVAPPARTLKPLGYLPIPRLVFEGRHVPLDYPKSKVIKFADANRRNPTHAERLLSQILSDVNGGVLRGRFVTQHVFHVKWILDFFFPEVRLGIEVDGSIHDLKEQREKDLQKDKACTDFDITLLRLRNSEVYGPRGELLNKIREAWRAANRRENRFIGRRLPPMA